MADIIFIKDGKTYFEGFDTLKDKAYITFRRGGIVISGETQDSALESLEYGIEYIDDIKYIDDAELETNLISRGFGKGTGDVFIKISVQGKDGKEITAYMADCSAGTNPPGSMLRFL